VFYAPGDGSHWFPAIVGSARVSYTDAKLGVDETRDVLVWTPVVDGPVAVDWEQAEPAAFKVDALARVPQHEAGFDTLAAAATSARNYSQWQRDFGQWVGRSQPLELLRSARTKLVSRPDESERDFRIRLQTTQREQREAEMASLREKYASKLATLEDRVRRAETAVERQTQQASESKVQAGVSVAATIFAAVLGRKAVSTTTLGRATTAARGMGRIGRESQDVARAQGELKATIEKRDALAQTLDAELQAIAARWDQARDEPLERLLIKPKRGGVSVQLVALVWTPR
jgi:Skp family chaperone for outer membrane proteins